MALLPSCDDSYIDFFLNLMDKIVRKFPINLETGFKTLYIWDERVENMDELHCHPHVASITPWMNVASDALMRIWETKSWHLGARLCILPVFSVYICGDYVE
jgi:hypothetical protein